MARETDALVRRPMPARYALLDDDECAWRDRACIVFWPMGYDADTALRIALSRDAQWTAHLRNELPAITPPRLDIEVSAVG